MKHKNISIFRKFHLIFVYILCQFFYRVAMYIQIYMYVSLQYLSYGIFFKFNNCSHIEKQRLGGLHYTTESIKNICICEILNKIKRLWWKLQWAFDSLMERCNHDKILTFQLLQSLIGRMKSRHLAVCFKEFHNNGKGDVSALYL